VLAQAVVAGEHAVVAGHVEAGRRDQGAESWARGSASMNEASSHGPERGNDGLGSNLVTSRRT
jgi:hypothetical protein